MAETAEIEQQSTTPAQPAPDQAQVAPVEETKDQAQAEVQSPTDREHDGLHAALRESRSQKRALSQERETMANELAELRAETRILRSITLMTMRSSSE